MLSKIEDHGNETLIRCSGRVIFKIWNERIETECWSRVTEGENSALIGKSENAISGKQMDSVQEETLAVSATEIIVDSQHNQPRLLQKRRQKTTEEDLRKQTSQGEAVHPERESKDRARITLQGMVQIRHVTVGILAYVKITHLNRDAKSATSASSCTKRLTDSPVKAEEK